MHHAAGNDITHSPHHLDDPKGWVFFEALAAPRRLVIFIHGFGGHPTKTWGDFPYAGPEYSWLAQSDLLFIGYRSRREGVVTTESTLRRHLPQFIPTRWTDRRTDGSGEHENRGYEEVILVGHSQGGLVLRRAITEFASQAAGPCDSAVLAARLCLFSPATAGFRPAGALGVLTGITGREGFLMAALRVSPAFLDLQPDSQIIRNTRRRTQRLAIQHPDMRALRALIAWADPEHIVETEKYDTDPRPFSIPGTNHITVCKPGRGYLEPFTFVETGKV